MEHNTITSVTLKLILGIKKNRLGIWIPKAPPQLFQHLVDEVLREKAEDSLFLDPPPNSSYYKTTKWFGGEQNEDNESVNQIDSSGNYGFGESEEFSMMMLMCKNFNAMAKINHVKHHEDQEKLDNIIMELNKTNQFLSSLWDNGSKLLVKPNMVEEENKLE